MRKNLLSCSDIVARAAQSDIAYWYSMNNGRCPNCCVRFDDLPAGANLYPHMVGECEQPLIGLNWIRPARNVDAPLADAEARRPVNYRSWRKAILFWLGVAALAASVLIWVIFF